MVFWWTHGFLGFEFWNDISTSSYWRWFVWGVLGIWNVIVGGIGILLLSIGGFVTIGTQIICCNPSFGLVTKARACTIVGQEGSPGVTSRAPRSAKEWEGMNPHTLKWTSILGVRVPMDSWIFRGQLQGSNPISLKNSLYHWKSIET